ncbi:MAG: DUF2141 domain-containing protein [Bacteroidota bacterium]
MSTGILLVLFSFLASDGPSSQLEIRFSNLEASSIGKNIYIGIWHDKEGNFPNGLEADIPIMRRIDSADFSLQTELANREYAVSVFIDLNGNGRLDTNFFGMPEEPYAFYRDYRPTLSAPDFDDCSFFLNEDKQIRLTLIQ